MMDNKSNFKKSMRNTAMVVHKLATALKENAEESSDDTEKFVLADVAWQLEQILLSIQANLNLE